MKNLENIGKRIKDVRNKNNMSQVRFGKKVGLSGKTISAYETGKCHPPLKILEKLSEAYDVSFVQVKSEKRMDLINQIDMIKNLISSIEDLLKRRF